MTTVASIGPLENPEQLYRGTSVPAERRRLQAAVVEKHRTRARALARRIVPWRRHWEEAEQVAAIGILRALEKYEPERMTYDIDVAFWRFARIYIWDELEMWLGHAVYWRPSTKRAKGRVKSEDPVSVFDFVDAVEATTPEDLYERAELCARVAEFLETLSADERVLLTRESRNRFCSVSDRRYLSLVERARAFVRGTEDDGSGTFKRGEAYRDPAAPAASERGSKAS